MTIEAKLLTADDLWAISHDPDHEGHGHELLDGVLVEMAPTTGMHGSVEAGVAYYLFAYAENHGGNVWTGEPGFILHNGPDRVRAPDVCFFVAGRVPRAEAISRGYSTVLPDVVVEVVSPNDTAAEVEQKVMEWLAAGVRLVLVVYPGTRSIIAYQGPADVRRFTDTDILDAEPVLPGFACPVARLFRNEQ